MNDDIHDELVQTYLKYFRANEKFARRNSVRLHAEVRRHLRQLRKLAKVRMEEIHIYQAENKVTRKDIDKK
jgi:hypothetical protein